MGSFHGTGHLSIELKGALAVLPADLVSLERGSIVQNGKRT